MSLKIYMDESEIPDNVKFVNYNDLFFNGESLRDDKLSERILQSVDQARYSTEMTFIGRYESLGNLSTGCKTLLNVLYNPDKCFDVIECGANVLSLLPLIKDGNILWKTPTLHYVGDTDCDIEIRGRHFTKFKDFLSYVMD